MDLCISYLLPICIKRKWKHLYFWLPKMCNFFKDILLWMFFIKHDFSCYFVQVSSHLFIYLFCIDFFFCLRVGNLFVTIFIDSRLRASYLGNYLRCIFLAICSIKSVSCLLSPFIYCSTKFGTSKQTCPAYFLL